MLHRTKLLAAARPQLEAALSSHSESVRGASPARVYESPPAEADGVELELPPRGTITGSKRPVDYPWDWVSPQLLNRKGEEIYCPVVNDANLSWARRGEEGGGRGEEGGGRWIGMGGEGGRGQCYH